MEDEDPQRPHGSPLQPVLRRPGGRARLVWLLTRYRDQIEADLALIGWDLAALWTARRWRFLLNLIDHLPRTSHLTAAMADDDELAENSPEPTGSSAPTLTEWSPTVERLTLAVDRLGELIAAVYGAAGGKAKAPKPLPRPITARDRVRSKVRQRKRAHVLAELGRAREEQRPSMAELPTAPDERYTAARTRTPPPKE
ncbi:hypothetical protein Q7689_00830 [Nocardiopsis tropica]|uniref:hypothetical protein n=1 Tax=Nocardiopsis tropica TaxID=109330 RepID=UPI002E891EAE|nr:hypothetical protein [Nocardiopsis tropica]